MIATPMDLHAVVQRMPEQDGPITAYVVKTIRATQKPPFPTYSGQREHWLGWLEEQSGAGHYGRKRLNKTAREVYERVVNPMLLVYLVEAAERFSTVERIVQHMLDVGPTMAARSKYFRMWFPWGMVEDVLERRFQCPSHPSP